MSKATANEKSESSSPLEIAREELNKAKSHLADEERWYQEREDGSPAQDLRAENLLDNARQAVKDAEEKIAELERLS